MITVTGAHCFTSGGEVIYHQSVSAESVGRVVGHLTHGADAYPVIFVCSDEMFITELNEDVDAVARLLDIKMPPVRPASYARGKDVLQLISFFKADREPHFMSALMPDELPCVGILSSTDVICRGVDRVSGIAKCAAAYEGLSLDEAMAFGDGGNDMICRSPFHAG